ncbi:hypothetical protein HYFRA_00007066 [Hymenoscyphus fraxineus]|uniref:MmgE/PrpD family protein n=1 Tax=Hymenoscyphus fraxineus TaxID=746836 RepID=A0A9N9KZY2_9HELO|nr:hypothetical protein HYFRA_00007066 [Hymenoscyphus fraxineus]
MDTADGPTNEPLGATKAICQWIHGLTLHDVPEEIQVRVKHIILDGIACAIVGGDLPWSKTAVEGVLTMESPGNCGLFGRKEKIGPLAAALLNSTFIQGFELDDFHSEAPIHSSSVVLPCLLATVQHFIPREPKGSVSGAEFLLAALVGYELGPRVGLGLWGGDILSRGWHSGVVFGHAAAAAASSKLLNLDTMKMEDALGIACTQACGLMAAQHGSMAKRMQHGFASRNGLFAAIMAKEGYTGIHDVFETPFGGFLSTFGTGSKRDPTYTPHRLVAGLGNSWEIARINVKPYASMALTHGTIDCIKAFQYTNPMALESLNAVKTIVVEMSEPAFKKGGWELQRPITPTEAQMSAKFSAASQIVDGQVLPPQFTPEKLESELLWAWIDKIQCKHNIEFDKSPTTMWYQRMTISFSDGRPEAVQFVPAPKGVNPLLTNEEIITKWRTLTEGLIDKNKRDEVQKAVLEIEKLENVQKLVTLLFET